MLVRVPAAAGLTLLLTIAACDEDADARAIEIEDDDVPASAREDDEGCGPTDDAGNDSDTDEAWVKLVSPAGATAAGIHYKEIANASGNDIFIGYGGYSVHQEWSDAWVDALTESRLADMGVRHLVAVTGPNNSGYANREIGNTKLAASLVGWLSDAGETDASTRIIVAAHSSGTFVAHELFGQLTTGHDPTGLTRGRIHYFNLDGARSGLNQSIVDHWARAFFVYAVQRSGGSERLSQNASSMKAADGTFGTAFGISADASGCNAGAGWCLHDALINTRPHNHQTFDLARDYTNFADDGIGRAVAVEYLDTVDWE